MRLILTTIVFLFLLYNPYCIIYAQSDAIEFGNAFELGQIMPGSSSKATALKWINVNTNPDTWKINKDLLVCIGKPTGVMRSEKQYGNFILQVEWMDMEAGGNSGVFVGATPGPTMNPVYPEESRCKC